MTASVVEQAEEVSRTAQDQWLIEHMPAPLTPTPWWLFQIAVVLAAVTGFLMGWQGRRLEL